MKANPPVREFSHGRVRCAIWQHLSGDRPTYTCTFERRFLEPKSDAWKSSLSFSHFDLLALVRVALDAAGFLALAETEAARMAPRQSSNERGE